MGIAQLFVLGYFLSLADYSWSIRDLNTNVSILFSWNRVEYDWPTLAARERAIFSGDFIPENNVISGIKWHVDELYVTVPRWRKGIPSTLNKVIKVNGKSVLRPFPSWEMNELGNCSALQFVHSLEIDPIRKWMWIVDVGRTNIFPVDRSLQSQKCPPKLVILDLDTLKIVRTYIFTADVAAHGANFLNDIVIDRENYAYITDAGGWDHGGLVVFSLKKYRAHRFSHRSMKIQHNAKKFRMSNGKDYFLPTTRGAIACSGIAMAPDFRSIYFSALAGYDLFEIPVHIARQEGIDIEMHVKNVGTKLSQSDGMYFTKKNLYFGALTMDAIYMWPYAEQRMRCLTENPRLNNSERKVIHSARAMSWIDSFAMDDKGFMYFTTNRLHEYLNGSTDVSGQKGDKFVIWKVYLGEKSYLAPGGVAWDNCTHKSNAVPVYTAHTFYSPSLFLFVIMCVYSIL